MNSAGSDTAEKSFLLHAARVGVGTEAFAPELLAQVKQWENLFLLAAQHSVTPLLHHALSPQVAGEIPVEANKHRRVSSRVLLLRNAQLSALLGEILDLLENNGISVIPFKGPVLAYQLYGQIPLRSSVDLDILIRAQELLRTIKLLQGRGFQTDCPGDPTQQAAYLRARNELHFAREGSFAIELHQAFLPAFNRFTYDYDGLWGRVRRVRFNERDVLMMPPEDLMLVLCAHGAKHLWGRIGWICDIARLLVRYQEEINWSIIDKLASSLGARRMVLLGVFLAYELLNAPLPGPILLRAKSDKTVIRLATHVSEVWRMSTTHSLGFLGAHLFFLRARERIRDRVSYCAHLMFCPTEQDHAIFPLPRILRGFYYPLHTLRVGAACAMASLNRSP